MFIEDEIKDKEKFIEANSQAIIIESLGIQIEEFKIGTSFFDSNKLFFSVPEFSTLEINESDSKHYPDDINSRNKTAENLIVLAKELFPEFLYAAMNIFDPIDDSEFMMQEMKEFLKTNIKYYAKIRTGETWTNKSMNERLDKLIAEAKKQSGYKEV